MENNLGIKVGTTDLQLDCVCELRLITKIDIDFSRLP